MGLDLVELAMSVEEEFDIVISDATLESIRTPQDYADCIYDEYQNINSYKCSSQVGFYKIRKLFIEAFNCKRKELKPDTKLEDLFTNHRREKWRRLNELLDDKLRWHPLKLEGKYHLVIFIMSLFSGLVSQCVILFFIVWTILYLVSKKYFATIIPVRNLSSLVRFTDESNAKTKYETKDEILEKIIEISIEELDISLSKISPDSKYVEDLGAG